MDRIASSLINAWPRVALVAALAGLVAMAAVLVSGLADAALLATGPADDGPLLAPFRWSRIAADLG